MIINAILVALTTALFLALTSEGIATLRGGKR